jgi:hypothetical protein
MQIFIRARILYTSANKDKLATVDKVNQVVATRAYHIIVPINS